MPIYDDIKTFVKYDSQKMEEYIRGIYEIEDNYLIGVVKPLKKGGFRINDLINPQNGKRLVDFLIGAKPIKGAKSNDSRFKSLENQKVLFQFEIIKEYLDEERIKSGDILRANFASVVPIDDYTDVFRELNIGIDDLKFPVAIETNNQNYKLYPVTEFYQKVLVHKFNNLKTELEHRENEIKDEQNRREEKIKLDQENLDQQIANFKVEEQEYQNNLLKIKTITEKLEELGIYIQGENTSENTNPNNLNDIVFTIPESETDLLANIQNQMYSRKKNWVYEKRTLRSFYSALKTNELIILSGPSGTGKSSLVSIFAEVIGAKKRIIPVQPSWTDKQDLLGFYNPIKKQYVSSPLLDVIIEAKENKEKYHENADLFLVCLDELNLAQVEYYLADILSVRELENEGIHLYSTYEYEQAMDEIKWFVTKSLNKEYEAWKTQKGADDLKELEFIQRYKNLTRFKPILHIPDNIRFIGTINIDGTTKGLSPKVVDRSFIIPIKKQEKEVQELQKNIGSYPLNAEFFKYKSNIKGKVQVQQVERKISLLDPLLIKLKADYNERTKEHIKKYIMTNVNVENNLDLLLDEILMYKILPRINHLLETEDDMTGEDFKREVLTLLNKNEGTASYKKLTSMLEKSNETNIFSYWS